MVSYVFLEQNELVMTLVLLIYFCLNFHMKVKWSLYVFHYGIEKFTLVKKIYFISFSLIGKQLRYKTSFYCVFIIIKGNNRVINPFNNSLI